MLAICVGQWAVNWHLIYVWVSLEQSIKEAIVNLVSLIFCFLVALLMAVFISSKLFSAITCSECITKSSTRSATIFQFLEQTTLSSGCPTEASALLWFEEWIIETIQFMWVAYQIILAPFWLLLFSLTLCSILMICFAPCYLSAELLFDSKYYSRQSLWDEWCRVSHWPTNWWVFLCLFG